MLGKLLKYDLKWVYKVVGVFYILAFATSIIGRGLSYIENSVVFSVITQFTFGFAIAMMANCLINSFMRLWVRFIRNVYKDESYLTHTLPVEKNSIFISKILSSLIVVFTTAVVIIVCLFICYYSKENLQVLKSMLELAASTYDTTVIKLLLLVAVVFFLEVIFMILIGYVGIIFGYRSNEHKMVKTLIVGIGLYLLTQIVTLAIIGIFGLFNSNVMNLINTTDIINVDTIKLIMIAGIGIYTVYILFYYWLGKKTFEKGVNVE